MSPETPKGQRRYWLRYGGENISVTGAFVVGREADCDLVLKQDLLVSRHHARFNETNDGLVISDLGSMNGVFVNQRRIQKTTLLAHGDLIAIGKETLEVVDVQLVPRAAKPTRPQLSPHRSDADPEPDTVVARLDMLSPREREVFELVVLGHTQSEIAQKLYISVKTIETHRAHIADKLSCRTRAELVAYAIAAGVLRK